MTKYVLLYEAASDGMERAALHFPAHRERLEEFHRRGELLMVGSWIDDREPGAMGIFTSRQAVEAFVADDPFMQHGVVGSWRVREWNEIFGAGADD